MAVIWFLIAVLQLRHVETHNQNVSINVSHWASICQRGLSTSGSELSKCMESKIREKVRAEAIVANLYSPINETWLCSMAWIASIEVITNFECFEFSNPSYFHALEVFVSEIIIQRERSCKHNNGTYNTSDSTCKEIYQVSKFKAVCDGNRIDSNCEARWHEQGWAAFEATSKKIRIIGNGVSAIFSLSLISLFTFIKELRSSGGRNVIALSAVLCVMHLMQVIPIEYIKNDIICEVLAIALHWLSLCQFLWTSCIAYDVFNATKPFQSAQFKKGQSFNAFCIISFGISTFTIMTCVVTEFSTNRIIGYGRFRDTCFIQKFWPNLMVVVLPVGLLLLFNTISLLLTIISLYRHQRKSKSAHIANHSSVYQVRNLVLISLKVSALLGIPWVLGFVGNLAKNITVLYMFVILTSLQGTLLFVAFCCNNRVWFSLKVRLMPRMFRKSNEAHTGGTVLASVSCSSTRDVHRSMEEKKEGITKM